MTEVENVVCVYMYYFFSETLPASFVGETTIPLKVPLDT